MLVYHTWHTSARHITFKLVTLIFHCLQALAPRYLSVDFIWVADVPSRQCPSLSSINCVLCWLSQLVTVGDRAFPIEGTNLRNGLPDELTSLQSHFSFRHQNRFCFTCPTQTAAAR